MKNALITGASRGLGKALARALLYRGVRVAIVARTQADLYSAARALGGGDRVHPIVADVGAPGAPERIARLAMEALGDIDLLLNNASILGPTPLRLVLDTDPAVFRETFDVNLFGPLELMRIFGGAMLLKGGGTIVNISSDAAVEPYPEWGAYGASKAALDHLSAILAAELMDANVRVLSVDPGEMNTAMHRAAIPDAPPESLAAPEAVAERIVRLLDGQERGRLVA